MPRQYQINELKKLKKKAEKYYIKHYSVVKRNQKQVLLEISKHLSRNPRTIIRWCHEGW
jgi:hypothetical protein